MQGLAGTIVLFPSAALTVLTHREDVPGDRGVPLRGGWCDWGLYPSSGEEGGAGGV